MQLYTLQVLGTKAGEFVSMGVPSDGSYGVPKGIVFSFPCKCVNGSYEIVQGLVGSAIFPIYVTPSRIAPSRALKSHDHCAIVTLQPIDEFSAQKLKTSAEELLKERSAAGL
jgi:hypothetical protein